VQSDKAGGSAKLPNCSDATGIAAVLYNDRVSGGGESVLHKGAGWRHEHARDHDKYDAFSGHG
jgi:hypothetical protein